jgi:hypothetical protein
MILRLVRCFVQQEQSACLNGELSAEESALRKASGLSFSIQ